MITELNLATEALSDQPTDHSALLVCLWEENSNGLVSGWLTSMTAPRGHTSGQIDRAGKVLSSPTSTKQESDDAIAVMDNWRIAHNRPLEMARVVLESRAKLINPSPTMGMRLK